MKHIRFALAMVWIVGANIYPLSAGPSPDALRQIVAASLYCCAILLTGASALPALFNLWWVGVLLVMALAPTPYIGGKLAGVAGLLLLGVSCHLGATIRNRSECLPWVLFGLVIAASLNALEGMLQWLGLADALQPWVVQPELRGVAFGALRQRNLFATHMGVGIVCVTWLLHLRRLSMPMAWLLACVMVFAMAASGSRTGFLELGALALLAFIGRKKNDSAVTHILLGALPVYLLATLMWPILGDWHGIGFTDALARSSAVPQDLRLTIWGDAIRSIIDKPFFGWGWLNSGYAYYFLNDGRLTSGILQNAHNLILQIAVEFGLPVAVIFLLIPLGWLVMGFRKKLSIGILDATQFHAMAIFGIVVFVHGMLEYPLWYADFLFITGFALGCLMATGSPGFSRIPWNGHVSVSISKVICSFMIFVCMVAYSQYAKILKISQAPFGDSGAYQAAFMGAKNAWMFQAYLDQISLSMMENTPENAEKIKNLAKKLLHFSADSWAIQKLLWSLSYLGDGGKAEFQFHKRRLCHLFPEDYKAWRIKYEKSSPRLNEVSALECSPAEKRGF